MIESNYQALREILIHFEIAFRKVTRNALNINCPFCPADENYHCGIFFSSLTFNCWKCGAQGTLYDLLSHVYEINYQQYLELVKRTHTIYEKSTLDQINSIIEGETEESPDVRKVAWPPEGSMFIGKWKDDPLVVRFLKKRKLSLDLCVKQLVHIGIAGRYVGRFLIPIFFGGKVVAFQGRDMADNPKAPRYLTEGNVSNYLYNFDELDCDKPVVITEGIFDAWAVRNNSTSTFSASCSNVQLDLMRVVNPPKWILCWDIGEDGSDAFWKSRALIGELEALFGSGKVGYVQLPRGEDASSLGHQRITEILNQVEVLQ